MRKLLSNKLYLMLISVLIAFIMWVSVVSISNPETTGSKAVTVEERNASSLTSTGKAYSILGSKTVKVNYSVQARDAYKVKSSDFRAYVDLSDIYDVTGTVRVVVQTVNNQDIISDCSADPQTLQVMVEDIISKTVAVKVYKIDRCPDGYETAASETTLTQVDITGPESLINSIQVAGVEVSVKDATGTLKGNAPLKFYDADDGSARAVDVSNNKYFSASAYDTDYTLYINTAKTIPIQYEISGTPADGYHYTSSTASVGSVIVMGNADILGQLSVITIPSSVLNIDRATSNKSWNIDLNSYLPAGAVISGTHETQITAHVEADTPSVYTGPGTTDHSQAETTAAQSQESGKETSADAAEGTEAAGGPGIPATQTEEETQSHTQSSDEEQTKHSTAGTLSETQDHAQTEAQDKTQEKTQDHTQPETETSEQTGTEPESTSTEHEVTDGQAEQE